MQLWMQLDKEKQRITNVKRLKVGVGEAYD
jgi:hypothetical protein